MDDELWLQDALTMLGSVKAEFHDKPEVYDAFLNTLFEYKGGM